VGKIWYFSGYDGDKRGNGRDTWVENEDSARKQALNEAPDVEALATKAPLRRFKDARGRMVELRQDVSLGLHGQDVTIHGERATFEMSEPEIKGGRPTGDVLQRFVTESGVTGVVRGVKVGPGRQRLIVEKRRRYFT
jgi:hypothetical protein